MSRLPLFYERLNEENIFHVYNRTNNRELMFLRDSHRVRFLANLEKYVCPFADILSYSLLPNHFHLLVEIKKKETVLEGISKHFILQLPKTCKELLLTDEANMAEVMENRFRSMFSGYSTFFNNRNRRSGNLLHRPFCRKWISTNAYFKSAMYYINTNAVHHQIHSNMLDHPWNSFHQILAKDNTIISLDKVYQYFDGEANMLRFHQQEQVLDEFEKFGIEEPDIGFSGEEV